MKLGLAPSKAVSVITSHHPFGFKQEHRTYHVLNDRLPNASTFLN